MDKLKNRNSTKSYGASKSPVGKLAENFLYDKYKEPLLIVSLGTGSGKSYTSMVEAVKACAEKDSMFVQFVVPQKKHRDDFCVDFVKIAKDSAIPASKWIRTGYYNSKLITLLEIASREDILIQIKKKMGKGNAFPEDWEPMVIDFLSRLISLKIDIYEDKYAKKVGDLLSSEQKESLEKDRRKFIEESIELLSAPYQKSRQPSAGSPSLEKLAKLLRQLEEKIKSIKKDKESIEDISRSRAKLKQKLLDALDPADRASMRFTILHQTMLRSAQTKKIQNGLDVLLVLIPELFIRHCDICIATYAREMHLLKTGLDKALPNEAGVMFLSGIYRERPTYFIMDEIGEGYKTMKSMIIDRCNEYPVQVTSQLKLLFDSNQINKSDRFTFKVMNRKNPIDDLSPTEKIDESYRKLWERYGEPGIIKVGDKESELLRKSQFIEKRVAFLGGERYPLRLKDPTDEIRQMITRVKEDERLLETTTTKKGFPPTYEVVWESEYANLSRQIVSETLQTYAEDVFPFRFALQIRRRLTGCNINPSVYLGYLKKNDGSYLIKDWTKWQMFEAIRTFIKACEEELIPIDDTLNDIIRTCFEYDVVKTTRPYRGKNERYADPVQKDMYESFRKKVMGFIYPNPPISITQTPFCPEKNMRILTTSYYQDGLYSDDGMTTMNVEDVNIKTSPEAILCEIIAQGNRVMALSATALFQHARNFNWTMINDEMPRAIVPQDQIKDDLLQAKAIREEKLDKGTHYSFLENWAEWMIEIVSEATGIGADYLCSNKEDDKDYVPLFVFTSVYWAFLTHSDPTSPDYISGGLMFAMRAPKESGPDPYNDTNLNAIAELLIERALDNGYISSKEAAYLRSNKVRYWTLLNNKKDMADRSEFMGEEDDYQPLTKKMEAANQAFKEGHRTFFITTYASFGAGFNLHLDVQKGDDIEKIVQHINNLQYGKKTIGFNLIGLCCPTNYVPHLKRTPQTTAAEIAKFKIETLSQGVDMVYLGDINKKDLMNFWNAPDLFKRNHLHSFPIWVFDTLIQAAGRTERSNYRLPKTYLCLGSDLKDKMKNISRSHIDPEWIAGASSMAEALVSELLCTEMDMANSLHEDNTRIVEDLKRAEKAYKDAFTPHMDNPTQKVAYAANVDKLIHHGGIIISKKQYLSLPLSLKPLYIKIIEKAGSVIQPEQIHFRWNGSEREYCVIKKEGQLFLPHEPSWKSYDPYMVAGIQQIRDLKVEYSQGARSILEIILAALSELPLFQEAKKNMSGLKPQETTYYLACPDLALKIRGCLPELLLPKLIGFITGNDSMLALPHPAEDYFEQFDAYIADRNGNKHTGIDLKNWSYLPKQDLTEKVAATYTSRMKKLGLQRGIILQIFPFEKELGFNDEEQWKRIIQIEGENLHPIGPLFDRNWQLIEPTYERLKSFLKLPGTSLTCADQEDE